MKRAYLATLLTAFLQGVNTLFLWPVFPVVWAATHWDSPKRVYWLAFTGGLLTDFLTGRLLGPTAIYFLAVAILISFFRTRFEVSGPSLIIFLILSQLVWRVLL